ncbi:hypothetical protein CPB86DRAFT_137706 [Serendipita vermifera]|nr:hypothetical protein CPB86DRAFT_137706 [Serendipita vermifera]
MCTSPIVVAITLGRVLLEFRLFSSPSYSISVYALFGSLCANRRVATTEWNLTPFLDMPTFQCHGFYMYDSPWMHVAGDDGSMAFQLNYDSDTSSIKGSGQDNAGAFTIEGTLSRTCIRFVKSYGTHQWHYVGIGTASCDEEGKTFKKFTFIGHWGTDRSKFGCFFLGSSRVQS